MVTRSVPLSERKKKKSSVQSWSATLSNIMNLFFRNEVSRLTDFKRKEMEKKKKKDCLTVYISGLYYRHTHY